MSLVEGPAPPPDRRRVTAAMVGVLVVALVLVARLWYLQIACGDELLKASERNRTRITRRIPPRGVITDAAGKVLASTRARIVVRVMPDEDSRVRGVLKRLAELLDAREADLAQAYADNRVDAFQPVPVASDIGLAAATRIEENRYALPGVVVGPEPARAYLVGAAFGHILGYVGQCSPRDLKTRAAAGYVRGDVCGKTGVEGGPYDGVLRGRDGTLAVEVDALGRVRGELASKDARPGAVLRLNIRADLQAIAYRELRARVGGRRSGALVAMDPHTGGILALVSVPSFDPGDFESGISEAKWREYQDDPRKPLINRAVGSATAPGSVFKVITAIAGLETGRTSVYDGAYCSGVIYLGRWPKRCHRRSGHGAVGFTEAIAKSCDVFFYRLGQRLGPDTLARYARRMGLGARSGLDIAGGEVAGVVPDPAWKRRRGLGPWVGGDTVDYGIGQAMLACTPMQICAAISAIANDGTLFVPQVVASLTTYGDGGVTRTQPVVSKVARRLGATPQTLAAVRRGMEAVVSAGGTGTRCAIPGVRVAGKTGTAERRARGDRVNDAWFAGFAPADRPRIAVCVYVEEGGHGGETAAPIARAVMARYLGVDAGAETTSGRSDD